MSLPPRPPIDATREKLLASALSQFAARGFHGASIAQIAGEVGLTKQALLYHFKRKDDLYGEVLRGIAARLLAALQSSSDPSLAPPLQFEAKLLATYRVALANPLDSKVLMHELLEDRRRQAPRNEWFFKTVLDELAQALDAVPQVSNLAAPERLARIYQLVSAIEFFASSDAVLRRFYGEEGYDAIRDAYPGQLRALIRAAMAPGNDTVL
ncbi:MAG: TetR/AcrR family transcriptional regulator [Erythrobacter sp.]|jgi:AcrR family transcriptional regulator|nr:TetR/AcrR family transcriptional regulator [Erythrobacter sp.]